MSARRVQVVILCEDAQHEAFARRFLESVGWSKRLLRVEKCPSGRRCAEQWVRERYPLEVPALRSCHVAKALVVLTDADAMTVAARIATLEQALRAANLPPRGSTEAIALFVPRRNIETWLAYLAGDNVDEEREYPRLDRERECSAGVRELNRMCDQRQLRQPAPESLRHACQEYDTRIAGRAAGA